MENRRLGNSCFFHHSWCFQSRGGWVSCRRIFYAASAAGRGGVLFPPCLVLPVAWGWVSCNRNCTTVLPCRRQDATA